jgi:TetR/AcrR family transcriptional repressor of bet genes
MAHPSKAAERRRQIALGLLNVMAEKGFERASIVEIARAADLSPGLVHHYFRDKREILLFAIELIGQELEAHLDGDLGRWSPGPTGMMHVFIDVCLTFAAGSSPSAGACWVAVAVEAIREPEIAAAYEQILGRWARKLASLLDGTSDPVGSVNGEVAAAVIAAVQGYLVASAITETLGQAVARPTWRPDAICSGWGSLLLRAMTDGLVAQRASLAGVLGD